MILVGTHLDVSDEKQRKACISKITKELLNKRGFPTIRDYHFVNATEESDALAKLRKTIINESLNFKVGRMGAPYRLLEGQDGRVCASCRLLDK